MKEPTYRVLIEARAWHELSQLTETAYWRVLDAIEALEIEPRPSGAYVLVVTA